MSQALPTPEAEGRAPVRGAASLIERWRMLAPGERAAAVDAWLATGPDVPVLGERSVVDGVECVAVTFLAIEPDASEVMVHLNSVTDRHRRDVGPAQLERLAGTDLWHLTYQLPVDLVVSYRLVAGEPVPRDAGATRPGWLEVHRRGRPDPLNPWMLPNPLGEASSVLVCPEGRLHPDWRRPHASHERGDRVPLGDPVGDGNRFMWLDAPPATSRLLVLFDGETWHEALAVEQALARRAGERLAVACVPSMGSERRTAVLTDPRRVAALLEHGVLPAVTHATGRVWGARDVIVSGQSFGGLAAAGVVVTRPDLVTTAIAQSGSFQHKAGVEPTRDDVEPGDLVRSLAGASLPPGVRIVLTWGADEPELGAGGRAFARAARAAGAEVSEHVYAGGHDYAWWRTGLCDGLDLLAASRTAGHVSGR